MWKVIARLYPVILVALVAGIAQLARGSAPGDAQEARTEVQAPARAYSTREAWAVDFLAALGNERPSAATVGMVVEWTLAEDDGDGALARNNPLNTTICGHNFVGAINGDGACGVGGYGSYQDGIAATVDTITQANFSAIAAALQANDAVAAKQALFAAPWAESHYGYGASWPSQMGGEP